MKVPKGNRSSWSKALALVFAVQLLVSSLCIATSAQAVEAVSMNHCHQSMDHSNMKHEMGSKPMQEMPMSACTHCATPDDFTVFANGLDSSPVDLLIAYVAVMSVANLPSTALMNLADRAQAPPRSSTTLYTTTQRIRI